MRGSPLLRALLVFLLLLGLAPVLWQVTQDKGPRAIEAPETEAVQVEEIRMELAFTLTPKRVSIKHLGEEVWTKEGLEDSEELIIKLPWPKEGGELDFNVEWPEGAPLAAMRVRLNDPERGQIERTLLGRGTKTGVLGFP